MTRRYCDRCNKEITTAVVTHYAVQGQHFMCGYSAPYDPSSWAKVEIGDLCGECVDKLIHWLGDEEVLE